MKEYPIHPCAELFPLMSQEELAGLVDDIKANGQREPVVIWRGQLVDGRNRATACRRLDREPEYCELDDATDPVQWSLSYNLHRRHLSPSQRAMVAVKLKEMLEPEAKERKKRKSADSVPAKLPEQKGDSRDRAAAAVGISGKLVDAAAKVTEKGTPELQAAVTSGAVSVSRAAKIADAPKESQAALIAAPRAAVEEPALKRMIERETDKLVIARWLFDSCTEQQKSHVSVAWSDWWKD